MNRVEITNEQKQKWQTVLALMGWVCPGFKHLFYRLLDCKGSDHFAFFTSDVPIAATDAKHILINPETFFTFTVKQCAFVVGHEIAHNIYADVETLYLLSKLERVPMSDGSNLPLIPELVQQAMDLRINPMLIECQIGEMPPVGMLDERFDSSWNWPDIYKVLYEDQKKGKGKGNPSKSFDQLLTPGSSTPGADPNQPRNQQQWAIEIAAAKHLEEMRSHGNLPGGMSRMFQDILDPKIPWTEHIHTTISRHIGSGGYNWKFPDRKHIVRDLYMPARSEFRSGWIVIGADVSGSTWGEIDKYLGEMAGVLEDARPRRVTIIWWDHIIQQVNEIEDVEGLREVKSKGIKGGGGTTIDPVMRWIDDQDDQPEVFICFTDGEFSFPHEPVYRTIWASVQEGKKYPWGDVVDVR